MCHSPLAIWRSARGEPTPGGSSSFRDLSGRTRFVTGLDRRYVLLVTAADAIGGIHPTCGAGLANVAEAYPQPPRVDGMNILRCPMCWRLGGCTELGADHSKVHFGDLDEHLQVRGMTFRVFCGACRRWPSSGSPKCTFARRRPRSVHPRGGARSSSWSVQRDRQGPKGHLEMQCAVRHFVCKSHRKHVTTCSHGHATAHDRRTIGTLVDHRQAGSLRSSDRVPAPAQRNAPNGGWR